LPSVSDIILSMTIKKPMKAPETAAPAAPSVGGATIADRFKLDMPDPNAQRPAAGKATVCAVAAALLAVVVAGVLTYVLWQHWEFLMPA